MYDGSTQPHPMLWTSTSAVTPAVSDQSSTAESSGARGAKRRTPGRPSSGAPAWRWAKHSGPRADVGQDACSTRQDRQCRAALRPPGLLRPQRISRRAWAGPIHGRCGRMCPTQAHRVGVADTHRAVNHHCGEHYTDCELQSQAGGCNAHFRHENFSTVHAPPIRHALQRALRGAGTAAAGGHAQASAAHAARGTGSEGEVAGEEQPRTRAAGNRRRRLT